MESLWNQGGTLSDPLAYEALQNKAISKNTKPDIPVEIEIILCSNTKYRNPKDLHFSSSGTRFDIRFNKYKDI